MSKARYIIEQTFHNIVVFITMHAVAMTAACVATRGGPGAWVALAMAAPFFASQIMRNIVKNFFIFIILHAAMLAAGFFAVQAVNLKIICSIFMFAIVVYSFVCRLKKDEPELTAGAAVLCLILQSAAYIVAERMGYAPILAITPVFAAVAVLSYLLYSHMKSIDNSISLITLTTVQPVREILSLNNKCACVFAALASLAALAASFVNVDASAAGGALIRAIRFLFSLIPRGGAPEAAPEPEEIPPLAPEMGGMMDQPPGEPPLFWAIAEKIMAYVFLTAFILFVIGSIAYLCLKIYRRFYQGRAAHGGDIKEFVAPEMLKFESLKKMLPNMWGFGPHGKARRKFYKKVRRHIARGVPITNADAPCEMGEKILKAAQEDIAALTADYEKERYGEIF